MPVHLPPAQWSWFVHGLLSVQKLTLFAVPAQTPAVHVSCEVQTLLSLQLPPLAAVCVHAPVVASHESVVHGLLSLQPGAVPTQVPLTHWSLIVQVLPSLQVTPPPPPPTLVCTQLPDCCAQVSLVQTLLSLQFFWVPPVHAPI